MNDVEDGVVAVVSFQNLEINGEHSAA